MLRSLTAGRPAGKNSPPSARSCVEGCAASDGAGAYRVQEIADRVHLSQSALSRLIGRLEKDGLVERCMCPQDRRGVRVSLTPKGHVLHGDVLPVQRAVLGRIPATGPGD